MKKMKLKSILLLFSMLLTTGLGGCSLSPDVESSEEEQNLTATEVSKESVQEEAAVATEALEETGWVETTTTETEEVTTEMVLLAYQEILKASPAIEGEHVELEDASFDYDQNQELFGDHFDRFAIVDINQDDIPELIVQSIVNFKWTPVSVYTYVDGEAVLLKDPLDPEAHGTFEQICTANGSYFIYICEDSHIHNVWRGTTPLGEEEENYAYTLEGTTLTEIDCVVPESENTEYFYDIALPNTAENVEAMLQ